MMNSINLDEYYSAGYFLIRKAKRPFWLLEPAGLVSDEMISLEDQFCPKFHLNWGWGSTDRIDALNFGIDETKWEEFEAWCAAKHREHEIEVWSMFSSTTAVRRFVEMFIPDTKRDGLKIVEVGVHQSCLADWQEPLGSEGVEIRIPKHLPMENDGQILGFDIAGYDYHNFSHTLFSHGHHRGVSEELGIRPGNFGLLQVREEAVLARDYANEHDAYIVYKYWLLVAHPIEFSDRQL